MGGGTAEITTKVYMLKCKYIHVAVSRGTLNLAMLYYVIICFAPKVPQIPQHQIVSPSSWPPELGALPSMIYKDDERPITSKAVVTKSGQTCAAQQDKLGRHARTKAAANIAQVLHTLKPG